LGHNREVYEEGFNELSELLEVVVIELLVLALFCIATTGIFQKKKNANGRLLLLETIIYNFPLFSK
jgi:hypothetical protein